MRRQLINAALFQLGWFACVLGANSYWLLIAVGVVLMHLWCIADPARCSRETPHGGESIREPAGASQTPLAPLKRSAAWPLRANRRMALAQLRLKSAWAKEGQLLLWVTALGTLLDSVLAMLGVFGFTAGGPLIPLWLILMWTLLATTLNHCLAWTAAPWWRASLLGAIAAPLSYYAGAQLADVQLPLGRWPSLILLGLIWALLFPSLHWLARYLREDAAER